jgi:hypothetical protein
VIAVAGVIERGLPELAMLAAARQIRPWLGTYRAARHLSRRSRRPDRSYFS